MTTVQAHRREHETTENWDVKAVTKWLKSQKFDTHIQQLFADQNIDGYALLRLCEDDLRREPMNVRRLGDIKHLIGAIDKLMPSRHNLYGLGDPKMTNKYSTIDTIDSVNNSFPAGQEGYHVNQVKYSKQLKPERFKALVATVYALMVVYLCSFIMTIVNERIPDRDKYPPLPDLFLDNVPLISWAFTVSEYIAVTLFIIFGLIAISHKHRFIILRRFMSLIGTLYLLRGVCMLITSLSVPSSSFKCEQYANMDFYMRLKKAWAIMCAGGMALNGVRNCGDYMFSGHTTTLTMLCLFIDEYSDKNYPIIKTLVWILNFFGIFFIMAGHEHYSIDVFIAFYLTTRLFLYYHTLADNKARLRYDETKVRVWFPLFSYFESEINGAVPHEYEWPLALPDFRHHRWSKAKSH